MTVFDNNPYHIVDKKDISKSPKTVDYIKDIYGNDSFRLSKRA